MDNITSPNVTDFYKPKFQTYQPKTRIWNHIFSNWGALDPANIDPRLWLYGNYLLLGSVSATIADGGIGKSILGLTEAIAIVANKPLLGIVPTPSIWDGRVREREVFYYNAEESQTEIERRVCAICEHFGIDRKLIDAGLHILSGHKYPLIIGGRGEKGGVELNYDLLDDLRESPFDYMIFDPFVSVHRCGENQNEEIDVIVKACGKLAATPGAHKAISLTHHTPKLGSREATGDDGRGASALRDGTRALRYGNRMTEAEGQRFKVDDHRRYFRMDADGKANYSPLMADTRWYEHISVDLPNGDNVGVVAPWKPPGQFDDITPEHIQQVCDLVRGNEYRADVRTNEAWIGNVVAEVVGLDVEDAVEREQVKDIVNHWFETGVLTKVAVRSKKNRNMILGVRVAEDLKK